MQRRMFTALGAAARWARRLGLKRPLGVVLDAADAVLMRTSRPPLAASVDGVELRGYLRHRSFLAHVARGDYEPYYRRLLLDELDTRTVFVDAGAHVGMYTLLAAPRVHTVVALEPDPYNVAALRRNVERARLANVRIVQKAVADRTGRAGFRSFHGTVSGSLVPRDSGPYRAIETDLTTVDDELAADALEHVVVKLDVEGAEPLALAGMVETIARADEFIAFVEVNPQALVAGGSSPADLVGRALAAGLECAFVDEQARALEPVTAPRELPKGNLRCRKPASAR
jgi:FkbM family methyltransferase